MVRKTAATILAVNGGEPVRKKPFPSKLLGATLIGNEELVELVDVINQKSPFRHYGIGMPEKTTCFEQTAAAYLDIRYTLAVSSGSAALYCAMAAIGVGPGDEVILPAFGWYSDYCCIINAGALPVFAEINDSLTIDPDDFAKIITPKTKAVIVIHYQGAAADMDRIIEIASRHNIRIIEDVAQAFGGEYKGRKLGTIGDIGVSSFQGNKMLTCGEGGLLYTSQEMLFVRAVRYHDHGFVRPVFKERLEHPELASKEKCFSGLQFRMSELQGAVMHAQIKKLPFILATCRTYYKRIVDSLEACDLYKVRPVPEGSCGITLFLKFKSLYDANRFSKALSDEGIPIGPSSGCENIANSYLILSKNMPFNKMPPYWQERQKDNAIFDGSPLCPDTDEIISRYVGIGIGPTYGEQEIDDIINAINKVSRYLR